MTTKTVKVRIAVAVDSKGGWNAFGNHLEGDKGKPHEAIAIGMPQKILVPEEW